MMKKIMGLLLVITLLFAGCSSGSAGEPAEETQTNQSSKILNVSTSYFEHYKNEQSDTAYTVSGTVAQENDGNAVLVHIYAEKDATVSVAGTLTRVSGEDTRLVYRAPDGVETKIADNSAEKIDGTISISAGESTVVFMGESAVYDFEIIFGLTDGVSYRDL